MILIFFFVLAKDREQLGEKPAHWLKVRRRQYNSTPVPFDLLNARIIREG